MSDEHKTEELNLKSLQNDSSTELKPPKLDIDNLHPEAQRRLEMLDLITINANGEKQGATDEEVNIILNKQIQNEDPNILADKYMMQHGIYELFKVGWKILIEMFIFYFCRH
jgi:hypothetical protein